MALLTSVHPVTPDEHRAGFRVENEGFFVVARKSRALGTAVFFDCLLFGGIVA